MVCFNNCEYPNACAAAAHIFLSIENCCHLNEFVSGPNGNLYKAFEKREVTWSTANESVNALANRCGIEAHLATILSLEEDVFVHELGRGLHFYYWSPKGFWVGGFQNVKSQEFKEPGGEWEWLNNEGPISTPTHPIFKKYENWAQKEPNDFRRQPTNTANLPENHMTVCTHDTYRTADEGKATGWNDEFPGAFIRGYIVEVEVANPTVFVKLWVGPTSVGFCDSNVDNLRLPSPVGCPPRPISSLVEGCEEHNPLDSHPLEFKACMTHITMALVNAGYVTAVEKKSIMDCVRD